MPKIIVQANNGVVVNEIQLSSDGSAWGDQLLATNWIVGDLVDAIQTAYEIELRNP